LIFPAGGEENGTELFNGSLRDECLNLQWSETLGEAKAIIEDWRREYT
jgi:putative transposase